MRVLRASQVLAVPSPCPGLRVCVRQCARHCHVRHLGQSGGPARCVATAVATHVRGVRARVVIHFVSCGCGVVRARVCVWVCMCVLEAGPCQLLRWSDLDIVDGPFDMYADVLLRVAKSGGLVKVRACRVARWRRTSGSHAPMWKLECSLARAAGDEVGLCCADESEPRRGPSTEHLSVSSMPGPAHQVGAVALPLEGQWRPSAPVRDPPLKA
jgi:hypothetical protein